MAPALTLYLRCTENDVEHDFDGGRVVFKPVNAGRPVELVDGFVVLSASTDAFLRQYPATRDEKQAAYFKLTLEPVDASALPPAPVALTHEQQRIAELEAEVAKLAAANGGQ